MSKQLFSNDAKLEVLDPAKLTLHPVVFLFPELNAMEFDALVNSVRAHGQIDPVWITNENEIIDGRHRWLAQKKLGAKVQCRRLKNYTPELLTSIIDHCIAQNINRRHMTKDQRSIVAVTMEKKRVEAVAAQEKGDLSLHGGTGFSWNTFDELLERFRIQKSKYNHAAQVVTYGQEEIIDACAKGIIPLHVALLTAGKTKAFTKEDAVSCLSSKDPKSAILDRAKTKWAKPSNKEAAPIAPVVHKPAPKARRIQSDAYRLLEELATFVSSYQEHCVDVVDFSGIWREAPDDTEYIFGGLVDSVRVFKKVIAKLEAARAG